MSKEEKEREEEIEGLKDDLRRLLPQDAIPKIARLTELMIQDAFAYHNRYGA